MKNGKNQENIPENRRFMIPLASLRAVQTDRSLSNVIFSVYICLFYIIYKVQFLAEIHFNFIKR